MSMDIEQVTIAAEAVKLAKILPFQLIQTLAKLVKDTDLSDWPASRARILQNVSHPYYRTLFAKFLDNCRSLAAEVSSESLCLTLLTAACGEKEHREGQSYELVWSGPDVGVIPLRQTEQALLQLITSATQRLLVVSYAIYNIPRICEALVGAANRGVLITVIIEAPDILEGQNTYNTLKALGSGVIDRCNLYLWPAEKRGRNVNGKLGALHVKCAVADGQLLFLSSANLTEYAFTINMELGLLIVDDAMPEQVESHFSQMIQKGFLVRVGA